MLFTTTMNMPECLISSMKIDVICLSNFNIGFWIFNDKLPLIYTNVGIRHCDKNRIAESRGTGQFDRFGLTSFVQGH
jgi:hypothetical protein